MKKRVITISRQFGSGGHSIGKSVAEQLGIPYYDKEILDRIVAETGFAPGFVEKASEYVGRENYQVFTDCVKEVIKPGGYSSCILSAHCRNTLATRGSRNTYFREGLCRACGRCFPVRRRMVSIQ